MSEAGVGPIPIDKRHRQQKMDDYWAELICAMVGEQFGDDGDQICGAVVSVRFKTDKVGGVVVVVGDMGRY